MTQYDLVLTGFGQQKAADLKSLTIDECEVFREERARRRKLAASQDHTDLAVLSYEQPQTEFTSHPPVVLAAITVGIVWGLIAASLALLAGGGVIAGLFCYVVGGTTALLGSVSQTCSWF